MRFKIAEALARDVGRAVARLDPDDMRTLGLEISDFVEVVGKSGILCKVRYCRRTRKRVAKRRYSSTG